MAGFISAKGKVTEEKLNDVINELFGANGTVLTVYTTRFCCTAFSGDVSDIPHLLELRAFDENREFKAVRSQIGGAFTYRLIDDNKFRKTLTEDSNDYSTQFDKLTYDEKQFLDIAKNEGTQYVSIGGGKYTMPEDGLEKVLIRHYGEYDDDGMLCLKDYRIVKLLRKGEN